MRANKEGKGKLWSHYRDGTEDRARAVASRLADADGMETVEDWNCHPSCPVGLLGDEARFFPTFAYGA